MNQYPRETENLTPYFTAEDYDEIHVCSECKEEYGQTRAGDDRLGYCHHCQIVEGDTEYVYENRETGERIDQEEFDNLPEPLKP